ncbi:MAG: ribosomal protein S18-alanine N-acetyltransferase [Thermomicrobiales bacterium]
MTQDDVPEVSRVERRCFTNPWPSSAYRRELQNPKQNWYVVLRAIPPDLESQSGEPGSDAAITGASPKSLPRRSLFPISLPRKPESNGHHPAIIGFAGMWMAFDEAHITTIGVDAAYRGRGLGELLLLSLVDEAISRGANWLTLEVRVSNTSAQTLYRKYGLTVHGTRKRYYSDNNEDALIMWSPSLREPSFRERIEKLRNSLDRRLGAEVLTGTIDPFAAYLARVSGQ